MKITSISFLFLISALALPNAQAAPFTFSNGDLVLGFQATSGTGTNLNVFFNLGPGTGFRDNGNQGVLGNIGTTLSAAFGSNWYERTDLWFGVVGNLNAGPTSGFGSVAPVNGDPSRTFYTSTAAGSPGTGLLYAVGSYPSAALGGSATYLGGLEAILPTFTAEANGSAVLSQTTQPTEWNNGWTFWNPTPGAAFVNFAGGIQQNFGKGGTATYVDVQRVLATNTGAIPIGVIGGGTYETTISISSTGVITSLSSSSATPFSTWIGTFNPPLTNSADREPAADPDKDGLENVLEFVLNGNPAVSGQSILPTLNASGSNFVFNFTRRADSAGEATQVFEYSTDLADWTTNTPITIPTTPGTVGFVTVGASTGTAPNQVQAVTITIAKGSNTKLFGRLKAVK